MPRIPFLRPNLVPLEEYAGYLRDLEQSRIYSNFGPLNTRLEQRVLAECFANTGAVSTVNNATSGLMLAIALARRPGGRYAVMPSFTFPATPLAAMWAGLEPYFVDVHPDDFCLYQPELQRALQKLGDAVAVVVPYAAYGFPMDLAPYAGLMERGVPVVVDAASSFGSSVGGTAFGTGFRGSIVYSFHATKAFAIGEGGLVYSADAGFIHRLREAANFGFGADKISRFCGLNAKLPEIAAAIGLATLDRFPEKKHRRMMVYQWYRSELEGRGLLQDGWTMQKPLGEIAHQYFPLFCPRGVSNQAVVKRLAARSIDLRTYFSPPCHEQPVFQGFERATLANTEMLAQRALSCPLWEEMTREQVSEVVAELASSAMAP